jgi:hypothetical protein
MWSAFGNLEAAPGVFAGSALGGSLASGAPVVDVMQSMQGAIGVTIGYMAGTVVYDSGGTALTYAPWIGAALVPLVAGGVVDRALLGLVVGGFVGAAVQNSIMKPVTKNTKE